MARRRVGISVPHGRRDGITRGVAAAVERHDPLEVGRGVTEIVQEGGGRRPEGRITVDQGVVEIHQDQRRPVHPASRSRVSRLVIR
jgi:hypothetical protein